MKKKILLVVHEEKTTPGSAAKWCRERAIDFAIVKPWELSKDEFFSAAIIFGGDTQIWEVEKNPWLAAEKKFLAAAIKDGKPLFGICLGAQLLAEQLGAVAQETFEIEKGWFEKWCRLSDQRVRAVSWHTASFSLPAGARLIAGDSENECQGFGHGQGIVGYQFHCEIDDSRMKEILAKATPSTLRRVQARDELAKNYELHAKHLERWFFARLDAWWGNHNA